MISAQRHSRRVRWLRLGLPVLAVGLCVGLVATVLWPTARKGTLPTADLASVAINGTKVVMQQPVLQGYGKQSKPYELRAETATQDLRAPHLVDLAKLNARIGLNDGSSALLRAVQGHYNTTEQKLEVREGVNVKAESQGYDAHFTQAIFDFKANTVVSQEPVTVKFREGLVKADSMSITQGGTHITFKGRVNMTITPPEDKKALEKHPLTEPLKQGS